MSTTVTSRAPLLFNTHIRPGEIWRDTGGHPINAHGAGFLHHEGITYWYGEHKIDGEAGNAAHVGVRVYASRDLLNWSNEGVALAVSKDPTHELTAGCIIERPKVIFNARTARFVMWFHLEPAGAGYEGSRSGVAVADTPAGPFTYLGSLRPNAGIWPDNVPAEQRLPLSATESDRLASMELPGGPLPYYPKHLLFRRDFSGGQMARDMTFFVDEDGAAYHVYSSEANGTLHISLLSEDYLRPAGRYVRVFPGGFNEAPALFKYEGRYFMITSGCSGWAPNQARVSVADSIWGPWEELGNPCLGDGWQTATTFDAQSTYVLPVPEKPGAFIFVADRWRPANASDGRYVWLPIRFRHGVPVIEWNAEWDLGIFG
ncbi:MAG TPA: glycoside hydrolase family 43 protein [Rariglobus sp.]|nr:glycoside hydrolase family 43 protein [Rariglobus sp.]